MHAWPDSGNNNCDTMQAHATYIQQANQATIQSLQANMNQQGC